MAQVSQSFSGLFPVVRGGHRRCLLVLVLFGLVCALSVAQASSSSEGVKQQVQELSEDYVSEDGVEDNSQAVSSIVTRNSRAAAKSSGSLAKKAAVLVSAVVAVAIAVLKREDIMNLFSKEEEIKAPGAPKSPEKKQAAKLNKKKMLVVSSALVAAAVAAATIYYQTSGAQEAVEDILPSIPKDEATARLFEHILPHVADAPSVPESLKAYIPSDLFSFVPTDRTTQAVVTLAATAVGLHVLLIGPVRDAVKLNRLNRLLQEYEAAAPAVPEGEPAKVPAPVKAAQDEKAALENKKAQKWRVGKMLDLVASLYAGIYDKLSRPKPAKIA